jgi:hypothetical protein
MSSTLIAVEKDMVELRTCSNLDYVKIQCSAWVGKLSNRISIAKGYKPETAITQTVLALLEEARDKVLIVMEQRGL